MPVTFSIMLHAMPMILAALYILLRTRYDVFEPFTFACIPFAILPLLHSIYLFIFSFITKSYATTYSGPMMSEHYVLAALLNFVGFLFFVLGYNANGRHINVDRMRVFNPKLSKVNISAISIFILVIGFIGAYQFVQIFSINLVLSTELSSKRFYDIGGGQFESAALGYIRWAASVSKYALVLILAYALINKKYTNLYYVVLIIASVLLSLSVPIMASSRSDVVLVLLAFACVYHYTKARVSLGRLALMLVLSLSVIWFMGQVRSNNIEGHSFSAASIIQGLGEKKPYRVDAKLLETVPEKWEYQSGRTLIAWLVAPIPRTIWPEKPIISTGQLVKINVYGGMAARGGGLPPSSIGDFYINYGPLGVGIAFFWLFIGGWAFQLVYKTFIRRGERTTLKIFAYICFVVFVGPSLFIGQVSAEIVQLIKVGIVFFIILFALGFGRRKPARKNKIATMDVAQAARKATTQA